MNKPLPLVAFSILLLVPAGTQNAFAIPFGGIEFPQGVDSFADTVITYNNVFGGGPAPTNANNLLPGNSIGIPDGNAVSLGHGGLLELEFTDNVLTNSGDGTFDLHIFEVGPLVEDTWVSIRPTAATAAALALEPNLDDGVPGFIAQTNSDGFYEIGKVFGGTASIDIDSFFPAAVAGAYTFDAVQLIDDPNENTAINQFNGADIDSVGAITSMAPPEICDGIDNDGDTMIDEDFVDLGQACNVGVGECSNAGVIVCAQDAVSTECSAVPGPPSAEVCDGLDNDCDALVDEELMCQDPGVGGEIIPIETTSLILAGAQTPAAWLVSSLLALGIGGVWITRNPNNVRNIKVILQDYLDRL